jgi:hypothetical protein
MKKYKHPFTLFVKKQCKKYGCKVIFADSNILPYDDSNDQNVVQNSLMTYVGYFKEDPLEITIASKVSYIDFLSTLVHEFSHFEQWVDDYEYWNHNKRDPSDILDRWLMGEDFKKITIKRCIDKIRDCELDCERRTIENIKKFNLPINIEDYCREASYILYHYNFLLYARDQKQRTTNKNVSSLIQMMPPNLDNDYKKIPRKIMTAYKRKLL